MASIEVTVQLPEKPVQEAREFGVLTDEFIADFLRAEVDRRVMEMVNEEIQAYRMEKATAAENGHKQSCRHVPLR